MSAPLIDRQQLSGVAVDLGGTKLAAGRFQQGIMTDYDTVPTPGEGSVDELLDSITDLTRRMELSNTDVLAVAVTGRVDQHGHWHAVNTRTLANVSSTPIKEMLSTLFGRSVHVLHDATAGALAEYHIGASAGCQRLAYITVSTGVGAGFVFDGLPMTSPRGMAGHVGFMSSRHSTRPCGSGRVGSVESIASGLAIARSAELAGHPGLNAKDVFEIHYQGQTWATEIIDLSATAIAELCSDLVALLDIDQVLIGGSVGSADGYHQRIQKKLEAQPPLFQVEVQLASLGKESVLAGALIHSFITSQPAVALPQEKKDG